MLLQLMKISYIALNVLLLFVAGVRVFLPFYLYYGNSIIRNLNYDRYPEFTSFWMMTLVPWDIILAISGIHSILKNDREQIFENTFKLSVFGLVVIWLMEGLGDRFQIRAPYLLKSRMKKYKPEDKEIVDFIQTRLKCCGYNNLFIWNTERGTGIPSSCCQEDTHNCTSMVAYSKGCKYVFTEYVEKLNLWLVLANFPFIELLVSLWNCFLTDILPTSNVIYELGAGEDHVSRRIPVPNEIYRRESSEVSPTPSSSISNAVSAAVKEYNTQRGIMLECPEHARQWLERREVQQIPTDMEAAL